VCPECRAAAIDKTGSAWLADPIGFVMAAEAPDPSQYVQTRTALRPDKGPSFLL
jgi:hypothetical protein